MSPLLALVLLVAIVLVATVVGVLLRRGDGRARTVRAGALTPDQLALPPSAFGERATIVQFSTELCAKCPATRRLLAGIAGGRDGVVHVDVDLTHRPDLAQRFHVLQTPTTLMLDEHGVPRARIAGAPARSTVADELDRIEGTIHA
ncbi:thioredoxin family protein [Microbacterium betulae]|uniref:Thioredoxin family protein n=1 Tax=Microbacterium betulae TaxID=2981139 RepID=A0AA97I5F3_9MICO|nr:thioredoxin family protein [Microbacterium sp. AB]WOF22032.1 thioredoxin family protein [Microbacterium sp. AB]